ncbi:MAG: hypothetical protein K9K64_10205 [Desulfohalobiaceae bacterium]|nr:hypothetical protein [Desulfohalobiaceae bacterium]
MKQQAYRYVKGHCGWDSVTLLYGDEIPVGREHRIAHLLLDPPSHGGIEIGFMYPPEGKEDIRLRIIDSTTRTWLPMCGGMSQVIGLAAFQTDIQQHFHLRKKHPQTTIRIKTDSGLVPIDVGFKGDRPAAIKTRMPDYPDYLYDEGLFPVDVRGIPAMKCGYFLIFRLDDLQRAYPKAEFRHRGPGSDLELLAEIQSAYIRDQGLSASTLYSMIYDLNPEEDGDARIFTRFFKGRGRPQATLFEAQCGTGTIAVGMAMAARKELPFTGNKGRILFEWGSAELTPDPYGLRKSILNMELENDRLISASFSHNIVELQSEGIVYLPSFKHSLY